MPTTPSFTRPASGLPWHALLLITLTSVAVIGTACAQQNTDPVVARVDGTEIHNSDLAIA